MSYATGPNYNSIFTMIRKVCERDKRKVKHFLAIMKDKLKIKIKDEYKSIYSINQNNIFT